tara:strand:+ start:1830 stop:2033 length:204 start_codon:yes stop_codon:yes gene_type:complete
MLFYQDLVKLQEIKLLFKLIAKGLFTKLSETLKLQEIQLSLDAQKKRNNMPQKMGSSQVQAFHLVQR